MFNADTTREMMANHGECHTESQSDRLTQDTDDARVTSPGLEADTLRSSTRMMEHLVHELVDIKYLLVDIRDQQYLQPAPPIRHTYVAPQVSATCTTVGSQKVQKLSFGKEFNDAPVFEMSEADFLKELPSYDENNFTRFNPDSGMKPSVKRPSVYISTKDHPSEQVITTEKTNILLRYLHQQWDRKNCTKRDSSKANLESSEGASPLKIPRISQDDSP